jgi:arylsulfatase
MELYGYQLPTTPNLKRYANHAVIFDNAYCTATNTDPSLTAIFTGKYPCVSGVRNHGARITRLEIQRAERLCYFTEVLQDNGFRTSAVDVSDRWHRKGFSEYLYQTRSNMYGLGSIGNQVLDGLHAYDLFFAVLSELIPTAWLPPANLRAEDVTDNAVRIIRGWHRERNFLFVHYWDTHTPYMPPREVLKQFLVQRELGPFAGRTPLDIVGSFKHPFRKPIDVAWLRKLPSLEYALAAYDGAVAHVDREIGRLLLEVEKQGQSDRTIVVLTSDHGESLLEHGVFFDHHSLYEPVVKVPLMFLIPDQLISGLTCGRIASNVSHVDLFPTLLGLGEIPDGLGKVNGVSCLPAMRGELTEGVERPTLMEEFHFERKRAIRVGRYKLIQSLGGTSEECRFCGRAHGDSVELFDLEADPHEVNNLAIERPDLVMKISTSLDFL